MTASPEFRAARADAALARLRARWVMFANADLRSSGAKRLYREAYDRYYRALGVRLGLDRDPDTGYFYTPIEHSKQRRFVGVNDMEEMLLEEMLDA